MAFDINNFVIDRVIRGVMLDTNTGEVLWSLNQISDPSLSISADQVDVNDALGARIAQFDRAKNAEFTAGNALFDLGLAASQFGTKKNLGAVGNAIVTPRYDTLTYKTGDTTATLSKTPVGVAGAEIPFIYKLNGDSTLGTKYKLGAVADATTFELSGTTLTYPTGLPNDSEILVIYEYEETEAVEVVNSASEFPTAGKFLLTVYGQDPCNVSVKYFAHLIFPNCRLSSNADIPLSAGNVHNFTLTAMQGYCDRKKRLFSIIIPQSD